MKSLAASLVVCATAVASDTWQAQSKPASAATTAVQQEYRSTMPDEEDRDQRWARQGFIGTLEDPVARTASGQVVYDPETAKWVLDGEAPPTVNPGLWRNQQLLQAHGLFKVADKVWQLRNIDPTNTVLVRGKTGWIVIDPGMTTETASNMRTLIDRHLEKLPIVAVIYSHSHVDHFGGIVGILGDQKRVATIVAPENFVEESSSEWIMIGNAMTRRGGFQWGHGLPRNPRGFVGTGLGTDTPFGTIRLIPPTDTIYKTGETRVLDGVSFEFQMVPETEAVSEMNIFLPEHRVFYIAENATATMHNVQTPRGAKARDARRWSALLQEGLELYGARTDALIFGHTWPRFGNAEIVKYIGLQRDNYKFLHDQTVRMINLGMTPNEIADAFQPPKEIAAEPSTHGYYGNYRHNARGIYQFYIGWWDGIPAHLNTHPPEQQAKRYLDVIGGAEPLMKAARKAHEAGDYRWSTELLSHLVFAEPDRADAKALLADGYEQLGYQQESANFRNIYLGAAAELRGKPAFRTTFSSPDLINNISNQSFIDLLAIRMNPARVDGKRLTLLFNLTDRHETLRVTVHNSVLTATAGSAEDVADVTVSAPRSALMGFFLQKLPLDKMQQAGMTVSGDSNVLLTLQNTIEIPAPDFSVVTP
jgi:alkyl sulfatase BDS1-like metallo-beta-lactamase superfamily hydrolase